MGYLILGVLIVGAAYFYLRTSDGRIANGVRSIFKRSSKREF